MLKKAMDLTFDFNDGKSIDFISEVNGAIKEVLQNKKDGRNIIRWTNESSGSKMLTYFFPNDNGSVVVWKDANVWRWTPAPHEFCGVRYECDINDIIAHDLSYSVECYPNDPWGDRDGGWKYFSLYVLEEGENNWYFAKVELFATYCKSVFDEEDGWYTDWRSNGAPNPQEYIEFISDHIFSAYIVADKLYMHNTRYQVDDEFPSWEDFKKCVLSLEGK